MIILKSEKEIEKIRAACQIVARSLNDLRSFVKPGMTTRMLDAFVEKKIIEQGAKPAFKGYHNYPATLCVSVNEEVVHGIPSDKILKEGDIVGLDLGAIYDGFYGDSAVTIPVGQISDDTAKLLEVTKASLFAGIEQGKKNGRLSDISHAIQTCVEKEGYSIVTDFVGHGIGRSLHEEPQIPNFGPKGQGPRLREGMVLAIEPMVNMGKHQVKVLSDGWTAVSKDGSLSAHFEHTIAITKDGPKILSQI